MISDAVEAIEAVARAAWPALESEIHDGWLLRFAAGYTRRANSANALDGALALDAARIAAIAARYLARDLTPIFRLVANARGEANDRALADAGYRFGDFSLVMSADLDDVPTTPPPASGDAAAWLAAYAAVSGADLARQVTHLRMLEAIAAPRRLGFIQRDGRAACVGLGVVQGEWLGLFDIATHADWRGRGLARQLCRELMAWGRQQGARRVFLQVTATNKPALTLYEALGLRRAYAYWYRQAPPLQ